MNSLDVAARFERDLEHWVLTYSGGKTDVVSGKIKKAFKDDETTLDLSCLEINTIPKCVGFLKKLKVVHLNGNNLNSVPDELGQLSELQGIALDYNRDLKDLPQSLGKIPTLEWLTTGGTGISKTRRDEILTQAQSLAIQDLSLRERINFRQDSLLFSKRPSYVQREIDRLHESLRAGPKLEHNDSIGLYNLLNFNDCNVIAQRIAKASPNKKDLYFIDLGKGEFWVDCVQSFLRLNYSDDAHHFHVISVTGEGEVFDHKETDGNVTTHKICGFKLENLLESFSQLNLHLVNSVEFIATRALGRLVDPLGTLEQAYHLLNRGNGIIFGAGFDHYPYLKEYSLGQTLKVAFGPFSYVTRRNDNSTDDFALFRSDEGNYSYVQGNFTYQGVVHLGGSDNHSPQHRAYLLPRTQRAHVDHDFGGRFHGFGTYVLEQLLGQEDKLIPYEGKHLKMSLFKHGLEFLQLYLNSYNDYEVFIPKT